MKEIEKQTNYQQLLAQINSIYQEGRKQAAIAVNSHLVQTYWLIGQYIVEFEQQDEKRAVYGNQLIKRLSQDLSISQGRGFSVSNLK